MSLSLRLPPSFRISRLSIVTALFCALGASVAVASTHVVTSLDDGGPGTLRSAIAGAAAGDTIVFSDTLFPDGATQTLLLEEGTLLLDRSLTIAGPGDLGAENRASLILDGGGATRLFTVLGEGVVVTVEGLGLTGGESRDGGAVFVAEGAEALFLGCDFRANEATRDGGALFNAGSLTLDECLLEDNSAHRRGGAIANEGLLLITRSLAVNNSARREGGGLSAIGGQSWIESSTFSGNDAAWGGAFSFRRNGGATDAHLQNVTITDNRARFFGGGIYARGKKVEVALSNALVAGNVATPNRREFPNDTTSWAGSRLQSEGHNLIQNPFFFIHADPTDLLFTNPKLLPLAENGGRTATHALALTSPALDGGDPAFSGEAVETDQRGFPRVAPGDEGIVDIGAYEATGPSISCPGTYLFSCAEDPASQRVRAEIIVPGGGVAEIEWILNGLAFATDPVTAPSDGTPVEITFDGPFPVGSSTLEVVVTVAGYELRCSATVEVADTDPPVLVLNGPSPLVVECGESYLEPGASAIDACEGEIPVTIDASAVQTTRPGVYVVQYSATDSVGNIATAMRVVEIVDLTPPVLVGAVPDEIIFELIEAGTCDLLVSSLPLDLGASDGCDAAPSIVLERGESGPLALPALLPVGRTPLVVYAIDASGNRSASQSFDLVVEDHVPPMISLLGLESLTVDLGEPFLDPGVEASDGCSEPVALTQTVDGRPEGTVDTCHPGSYEIVYTATDAAGNSASVSRTVDVLPSVVISAPAVVERMVEAPACGANFALASVVTVTGLPEDCPLGVALIATLARGEETIATVFLDELAAFPVGTTSVLVEAILPGEDTDPMVLATTAFEVVVDDPFYACLPNVIWPLAIPLNTTLVEGSTSLRSVFFQQVLTLPGESRWYRVQGAPGGQIRVFLQNLPADYNVVVYGDIQEAYDELLALIESGDEADQRLALLGAEFAPEAYSPEAYSPEAYSPEAYAPEAYSPEAYSPEAYSPEAYSPEAYSPEAYSPEAYSPEAYSPEAYSPEAYSPEAYSPEAYSPEAYSPEAYSPEAYSPEAYSPEAYASAQQRSLIGFSAKPGTSGEKVLFNTFTRSGEFYIRVRGRNGIADPSQPFDLIVEVEAGLCEGVTETETTTDVIPTVVGAPTSLLVWDSTRVEGSPAEVADLALALGSFATVANGVVLDVGLDPQVALLNAQADASPACPFAKNLVAEAIRARILAYRNAAPSIADITLLGDDDDVPFFRTNDEAGLASEANYFPPVFDGTHSQSSLRFAQVLTQDRYGARCRVFLATGPYDLPEIPVARLVENAVEMSAYLQAYEPLFDGTVGTNGVIPTPDSALSIGYDFLADAAEAIRDEFVLGLAPGALVDELIVAIDVPPALGWTADDLRAALLSERRDISFFAGHFSTSGMLAADYSSRLTAGEVAASPVDLLYALIVTPGCHSGYNTVDSDAIPFVTEQPDWAQAMARKKALLLSGTGYQYGDTDFIEYTERLQLEFFRQLRQGSGPVSLGTAMVAAKRQYLRDTSLMRGIHEKSLTQLTLYGLPMVKLDLPGTRLPGLSALSDIASTAPVSGPGEAFALRVGQLGVIPALTRIDTPLQVVGTVDEEVIASFWEGAAGVTSLPGEPVRAREKFNLSRPIDGLVRGIGFRGGSYLDLTGFRPLSGAPATETRGVHGAFLTEVLYPQRQWSLNQIGELCNLGGSSILNVFPIQYLSTDLTSDVGLARRFSEMNFDVFYSPTAAAAALANPVAINLVSSTSEDGKVTFAVEAAISGATAIQNLWITVTGLEGSPYYGEWTSFDLTAPETAGGIGSWEGDLSLLPGTNPADLRFIVQAVNAVGVTTFNANFGRFFRVDESTLDGVGVVSESTTLVLDLGEAATPTGTYRSVRPLFATLTDSEEEPIAGATLTFSLGPISLPGTTDEDGFATVSLPLDARPGSYDLEVTFAGDGDYEPSRDALAFEILKAPSTLEFEPTDDFFTVTADLMSVDGTPLKERTVLLVFEGEEYFDAIPVITDGAGQASLSTFGIPPGSYAVAAYFGQNVEISEGIIVPLVDPLYGPSGATTELFIDDAVALEPASVEAFYDDGESASFAAVGARVAAIVGPGLTLSRVSASGTFELAYPDSVLEDFQAATDGRSITAAVQLKMADETVLDGTLNLAPTSPNFTRWTGEVEFDAGRVALNLNRNVREGDAGGFAVTIEIAPGTGPEFFAESEVLELSITLLTSDTGTAATGTLIVGTEDTPWTLVDPPVRVYTVP